MLPRLPLWLLLSLSLPRLLPLLPLLPVQVSRLVKVIEALKVAPWLDNSVYAIFLLFFCRSRLRLFLFALGASGGMSGPCGMEMRTAYGTSLIPWAWISH